MPASFLARARFSKPYIVVWDDARLMGAWYDRALRLRASEVSPELLAYARQHAVGELADSQYRDLPAPAWGSRVSPVDCDAWILYDDDAEEVRLAAIPLG